MTHVNTSIAAAAASAPCGIAADDTRLLSDAELLAVSGGGTYDTALTVAAGFVGVAAATVGMPVVAGAFALGSIGASAIAIYSALNDEDSISKQ